MDWFEYINHPKGRENSGDKVSTSDPFSTVQLVCSYQSKLQQNLFYQTQVIFCERPDSSENFITMREPLDRLLNAA